MKAVSGKRYPSPRSNSPARGPGNENAEVQPAHGPVLSRSNSRKAGQSPYRRNPMVEHDENALANATNHNHSNGNTGKAKRYRSIKTSKSPRFAILFPTKLIEKISKCISEISREYHCGAVEGSRAAKRSPPQLPGIEGED
jgi:hypothetical protein